MTTYKMLSDPFLARFKAFMASESRNPVGAFDQAMPKTSQRKESTMSKYRYVPLANTGGTLFMRERSSNMAYDDVSHVTEFAQEILKFLHDKISEEDMARVEEMLKMEAGVKTDQQEEADKMIAGAEARRAGAQDSSLSAFDRRFPSARRIRPDDMIGNH